MIVVLVLSTISDHEPFLKQIVFVSGILVPLINTIFVFALLTFALFLAAVIIVLCMKWPSFRTRRSRGTDRINDAFVLYSIEDAESLDRALALYFGNDYIPSTLEHMILYGDSNISDAPCVREALVSVRRSRVAIIVVTRHFIEALRAALIGIELHCHILRKALARETKYAQYGKDFFISPQHKFILKCASHHVFYQTYYWPFEHTLLFYSTSGVVVAFDYLISPLVAYSLLFKNLINHSRRPLYTHSYIIFFSF